MEYKHIKKPPLESLEFLNESRRPIEAQKVSKTEKDIKTFRSLTSFNVPIDDSNHITIKPGTTLVCFENEVYISSGDSFTRALFDTKFLEMNRKLFEKVDILSK